MRDLERKMLEMIKKIALLSVAEFILLVFFFKLYSFWVFWGSFGAILGIMLMVEDIKKMPYVKWKKIPLGYLIRYFVYGIILTVGALVDVRALMISFVGIMNMKIVPFLSYKQ